MIKFIKAEGNSMQFFIKDGDIVFYNDDFVCKIGDMVLYEYNKRLYIHRIIGKRGNCFVISNDDDMEKHIVCRDNIYGKIYSKFNGYTGYLFHIILKAIRSIKRKWLNELS